MMVGQRPVVEADLHAYVDGAIDPVRRVEVEAYLARNPEDARRVAAYRAQAAALHELFDPVLCEPPGPEVRALQGRLEAVIGRDTNTRRGIFGAGPLVRIAAAVMLLVTGAVGGYVAKPAPPTFDAELALARVSLETFAETAVQAHAFYTAENQSAVEMGGEDRGALDTWLSRRLGRSVFGPDLSSLGYRLIGGRLLPTATGLGAQYMYENTERRRLTLFVGAPHEERDAAFSFVQQGDVATFYWLEGALAYALIGKLHRDELLEITKTVYAQLKAGPEGTGAIAEPPPSSTTGPAMPVDPAVSGNASVQPIGAVKPKDM